MQAFLRFRAVLVCGFALASALLLAVPASAASGPPVVGCITGQVTVNVREIQSVNG
jgi:hypothetical protein